MWRLCVCLLVAATIAAPSTAAWATSDHTGAESQSICIPCHCHRLTVFCDFAHNKTLSPIWNSTYSVPANITGMEVQLTDDIQFQLHGGLFRQNRVNRFVVKGTNTPNGNDQVELVDNAFRGNLAGYPDIQILGVSSVFVRSNALSGGEIKLRVEWSDVLVLFSSAFINMNMSCSFINIRSLQINETAFNPSTDRSAKAYVNLHIERSHISQINRFDVSMNKIMFVNCSIGSVKSHAFDVTKIDQLCFENCRIDRIEPKALTNKLFSEHVSITGSQIGTIDSKAIMGSGISKLTLRDNTIETIKEDAILVYSVYVYIERNRIKHQGKNWLHVYGDVIAIEENRFDNFAPIQLIQDQSKQPNCTFANNWLGDPQPSSLNFSNCEVHGIVVDRVCGCGDSKDWLPTITDHDHSSELYCQPGERISRCLNASQVHLRRYANEACINRTTLHCADGSTLERYLNEFFTKKEREEQRKGTTLWIWIGLGLIAGTVVVIIIAILYTWERRPRAPKDSCSRLSSAGRNTLRRDVKQMGNRERQLVKQLTGGNLTKEQCVETIADLSKCIALPISSKIVLADHMKQSHTPLTKDNADHSDNSDSSNDTYSVPLAIPLLHSNYALPLDSQDQAAVYAEPMFPANDGDSPPPYEDMPQYAEPERLHPQHLASTGTAPQYQDMSNATYATPVWRQTPSATPINLSARAPPLPAQRHVPHVPQVPQVPQFHPDPLSSVRQPNQQQSRFASNSRRQPSNNNNNNGSNNSNIYMDGDATFTAMELMDLRGAAALQPDTGSDHSGGSDETVKIDDIDYADA